MFLTMMNNIELLKQKLSSTKTNLISNGGFVKFHRMKRLLLSNAKADSPVTLNLVHSFGKYFS